MGEAAEKTRILLVEDHPVNQKVVTRILERAGCLVDLAEDGLAAVERAPSCPALILMDCSMPLCDGFEATRRIRSLPGPAARLTIVALTAHASQSDRARCLAAGMDDWLSKPVAPPDLFGVLTKYTSWTPLCEPVIAEGTLDRRVIDQLVDLGADDPEFLLEILAEFHSTAASSLVFARQQQQSGQLAEMRRTMHALRSASATVGALRLHAACARLESADDTDLPIHGFTWLDLAEHEATVAGAALTIRLGGGA
ncbi:MAG: response regulator [Pseudomonadota bacterium]|nr:response regulator [Pseudomonadota bacterium]